MIMAAPVPPIDVMPKLPQQTASVPDLQQRQPTASSSAAPAAEPATGKVRKTRHARRRRRGEDDDSEDEIVREAGSGSESERELVESEDSDVEDAEEPPALAPAVNGHAAATKPAQPAQPPSTIPAAANWSDMVSSELDGGVDGSLPVIDFAEMGSATEAVESAPITTPVTNGVETAESSAPASISAGKAPVRPYAQQQTARQAYLERLEKDPQFIPRVGAFWGHDDRLLDKGLRSMSPWWRDRQMAFRGRGGMGRGGFEGGFRGGRGRGRGGAAMYGGGGEAEGRSAEPVPEGEAGPSAPDGVSAPSPAASVPPPPPPVHPSDLQWGHDGFEELKRVEAERAARGRGRGSFRARGATRGASPARGGYVNGAPRPTPNGVVNGGAQFKKNRLEKPWTKDLAAHLYSDPALSPKDNQGAGIRLKFPGSPDEGVIVRLPAVAATVERTASRASNTSSRKGPKVKLPSAAKPSTSSATASIVDSGDFAQTVGGEPLSSPTQPDSATEVVTVTVAVPITATEPPSAVEVPVVDHVAKLEKQFQQLAMQRQAESEQSSAETVPAVNGIHATTAVEVAPPPTRHEGPPPTHIQIPPQPYPQFSYGVPLPPGVAMDENGVCFEIATGRVVILQHPAPSPMYHPRGSASLPGGPLPLHLRALQNRALQNPSPDGFVPSPYGEGAQPTAPEGYYTEQTGMPYFTQRRPSGAVSIRSPTETHMAGKPSTSSPASSSLRAAVHAAPFQPTRALVTPQPASYVPPGYFGGAYEVSPVRVNGPSALPDDPAIVGQDPAAMAHYSQYYPADPMYGYPQGEYAYTPYGYEGAVPEGYAPQADGRGPAVYY